MKKKKNSIQKDYSVDNEYSVDTVFRNDWLNRTQIIGDEYFSVDI